MKTQNTIIFALLIVLLQVSCNNSDPLIDSPKGTLKSEIIDADNAFGLDAFRLIYANEKEINFMISPLSISMALSMAYNGAEGDTKLEMEKAMRIEGIDRDVVNETYNELIESLTTVDPKVAMEIANSIWYRDTYLVEQDFLDVNSSYYDAEVKKADFNDTQTLDLINGWVKEKTHDKIESIIDEIGAETVMYIINAIYFNGAWTQEFNPENTQIGSFKIDESEYVQAELMQRLDTVDYFLDDDFAAIQLPYGDGKFNMMLLLPHYDKSISDITDALNSENWKQWKSKFATTNDVDIVLPKFQIEYKKSLKDILQEMGMLSAFKSSADFSNINLSKDLFISDVLHKTFIKVNEEGTEAAAVTAIVFENTSIDPNEPQNIYFHCTRPFLFAITEEETGAILFMGKVGNPHTEE